MPLIQDPAGPRPLPALQELVTLSGARLLETAARLQARENADHARRIETYAALREHCERDYTARKAGGQQHFVLTALRGSVIELAGVLHCSEKRIEVDLVSRDRVARWFPAVATLPDR